jgi:hypothetical protein
MADLYPYTIETRHILAAIPGDTNRDKLAVVDRLLAADESARVMYAALGDIAAVIDEAGSDKIDWAFDRISEIVDGVK